VVRAVQTETSNVVESIGRGSSRAAAGAELIRNAELALSAITKAARESKDRMAESVSATAQQMAAATAVAEQMQGVRAGVDRIRTVTREQAEATEVIQRSADGLNGVAQEVLATVGRQTLGAARIGESIEAVQRTVRDITSGLEEQVDSSEQVASLVRNAVEHTRAQQECATGIEQSALELERQAETLREAMRRFRIAEA